MHGFAQVSARLRLVERGAARTGAKSGVAERNSGTWRMEWDSNPRYAFDVYALSRRAPSTARPSIRYRPAYSPCFRCLSSPVTIFPEFPKLPQVQPKPATRAGHNHPGLRADLRCPQARRPQTFQGQKLLFRQFDGGGDGIRTHDRTINPITV